MIASVRWSGDTRISVRFSQHMKGFETILVTLSGKVMEVSPAQPQNAELHSPAILLLPLLSYGAHSFSSSNISVFSLLIISLQLLVTTIQLSLELKEGIRYLWFLSFWCLEFINSLQYCHLRITYLYQTLNIRHYSISNLLCLHRVLDIDLSAQKLNNSLHTYFRNVVSSIPSVSPCKITSVFSLSSASFGTHVSSTYAM